MGAHATAGLREVAAAGLGNGDLGVDLVVHGAHQALQAVGQLFHARGRFAMVGRSGLADEGLPDQRHGCQRGAQLVRHDAHGGQSVLQVLAPQVG